jgi:hypothetical protein
VVAVALMMNRGDPLLGQLPQHPAHLVHARRGTPCRARNTHGGPHLLYRLEHFLGARAVHARPALRLRLAQRVVHGVDRVLGGDEAVKVLLDQRLERAGVLRQAGLERRQAVQQVRQAGLLRGVNRLTGKLASVCQGSCSS